MREHSTSTDRNHDFDDAMTTLGDSMGGLGEKLTKLNKDIDDLQRSTERWGENQRAISESLSQAADSLAAVAQQNDTPTADTAHSPTGFAAADD